jgi:Mpv17 / PMP22 family
MTLEDVNTFYQTYPLQAAVLTCGVKASFADIIAQVRNWSESEKAIELKRNAAYIIYGGIFIGLMCHIEYDWIFPILFGTGHDIQTVAEEVLFDNFVSAPLMWLPPAYFIKAVMFDYPLKEGLDRYFTDIEEGLLTKYWLVWLPAQTFSFSVVPDHLRILFMAMVSFGWFIVLSSAQSQTDEAAEEAAGKSEMALESTSS